MTVRLFLTGKFLPNYVEAVFASRRLPPKAAVSACSRHSFVEGIRNGGLDVLKTAAVPGKSILGAQSCLPCNGFFLSPSGGQIIHYVVQGRCALIGSCSQDFSQAESCCSAFHIAAYFPFFANNSSWVPDSAIRPPDKTSICSAFFTIDNV